MDNWKSPFDDNLHKYRKQLDNYIENQLLPTMLKYLKKSGIKLKGAGGQNHKKLQIVD